MDSEKEPQEIIVDEKSDDFIRKFIPKGIAEEDIPNFLSSEREKLRNKYNVPDREGVINGTETTEQYYNNLLNLAKIEGVEVIKDFENYAEEHNLPKGSNACFADDTDQKIHLSSDFDYNNTPSVKTLEHEIVHALQYKYYPEMLIQQKEFEAYMVADGLPQIFENPKLRDIFLGLIKSSIEGYSSQNITKV